jgi:hypothetical protein
LVTQLVHVNVDKIEFNKYHGIAIDSSKILILCRDTMNQTFTKWNMRIVLKEIPAGIRSTIYLSIVLHKYAIPLNYNCQD